MKIYLPFICLVLFTACVKREVKDSCCTKKNSSETAGSKIILPDMSLYNLSSSWKNQEGKEVQLEEYSGKIQIVALIYTRCTYACPRIIADLKRIDENLKEYDQDKFNFLLVSMDPETDTPEHLKKFARENNMDTGQWNFLTASDDAILELAAVLNVKYKKEPDGEISHSNIITVLDSNGEIIFQQEGLGVAPDQVVKAVKDQLVLL